MRDISGLTRVLEKLYRKVTAMTLRWRVVQKLSLVVFLTVVLAAAAMAAALSWLSENRAYHDTLRRSDEFVQAASLALSRALAARDEVLLDALLHELKSRPEFHIQEAYVVDSTGIVRAHSRVAEYAKTYALPGLLTQVEPSRLSQVNEGSAGYEVVGLLQHDGASIGAAVVSFGTGHLAAELRAELILLSGATLPLLLISGLAVAVYGRGMARRLNTLRNKALAIGRGEWSEPVQAEGADEIAELTRAVNQMQTDLKELREKDRQAAQTIGELNRELRAQLEKVQQLREQLLEENAALRQELRGNYGAEEIIGAESGLRTVMEQARQVAAMPVTILITGESGTGKELIAKYLHRTSGRREGPFITVNCAALPATLIESELFGHEKGAFTGAVSQKKGKFELAHGGTIFLDEMGELPAEDQAKLLRVLQEKEIHRVGGDRAVAVDVRVIAATNRDLAQEVAQGRFREDLYYRLKVVELHCPALREHIEDLPVLAQHFIELYARRLGKPVAGISPSALTTLTAHHFPGNVRELENLIARAVALASTQVLGPEDFTLPPVPHVPAPAAPVQGIGKLLATCGLPADALQRHGWDQVIEACERVCLKAALAVSANQKEAAAMLGLSATKLHRLIRKYGLRKEETSQ